MSYFHVLRFQTTLKYGNPIKTSMLTRSRWSGFFLVFTLISSILLGVIPYGGANPRSDPDVFVGVDIAYGGISEIKQLVDEISSYTNLFVLGCTGVTQDQIKLEQACQYLFDKDMFFIIYQDYPLGYSWFNTAVSSWFETAKARWGSNFLGFYYADEVGGRQLDLDPHWTTVKKADSYANASSQFNKETKESVEWFRNSYVGGENATLFTSDYALYEFDYRAGYDVLLAQFGWNYSRQLNVGLCRGAAALEDKQWGVIITWTYRQPPYIESGEELYKDLISAYDNGAKYILVFDSNKEYTGGILQQEHLDALRRFWQYSQETPRKISQDDSRVACVLPKDYAYGFRGPNDKIWGLWEADSLSTPISMKLGSLLEQYDSRLDIVYDDALGVGGNADYNMIIQLNSSIQASPNPQEIISKQSIDVFWNRNFSAVLLFVLGILAVAVSSIVFLRQKKLSRQSRSVA
jgi:hypothetical protein